jgi:hypothetical protein
MHGSLRSWLTDHAPGHKASQRAVAASLDAEHRTGDPKPIEIVDLDSELDALGVGPDMVFESDEPSDSMLHS